LSLVRFRFAELRRAPFHLAEYIGLHATSLYGGFVGSR
jgi:hypothetical protein